MTYGELKTRMAAIAHRPDLSAVLPDFVEDARIDINRRFGLALAAFASDAETNAVLTDWPDLYLLRAMRSLYEYLNDGPNAQYYGGAWEQSVSRQNITAGSAATDAWADAPPQIIPEA